MDTRDTLTQAKEFLAKDLSGDDLREAYRALPVEVQTLYGKLRKDAFFVPENARVENRWEVISPSGKYKLVVTPFATGPSCWSYTQGIVYRKDDDKPIAEVRRNYSAFPHSWVEGHANGQDYLIAGADYQGQTVIELTTGARRDHLSKGTEKGHGFCWSSHRYDAASQLLVVCGCIWACPYEHRFYDFSNPMEGWPELETGSEYIEADEKKEPEIDPDGTIRCFQTRYTDDDDDDETDEEKKKAHAPIVDVISTFRREGLTLKLVEEWVSDFEKDKRVRREEYEKKYREWQATFKATDPLYLTYARLVKDPALSPEEYESVGQVYEGWAETYPRPANGESRWCRRIIYQSKKTRKGATVDLEWAVEKGPIKLVFYRDGQSDGHQFFEHSAQGMEQAFARAKEYAHVH